MKTSLKKMGIPFTMLPNDVASWGSITLKAKGIYYYLYTKPDDWDFSVYRIAKEVKESEKTIRGGLRELEGVNLLKRKKQASGKTVYWVTYPGGNFSRKSQAVDSTYRSKSLQGDSTAISKKEDNKEVNNKKEGLGEPDDFVHFYSNYPLKKQRGKALVSWEKLTVNEKKLATLDVPKRLKEDDLWSRGMGIPYPTTYLNQKRWTDEITPIKSNGRHSGKVTKI